MCRSIKVLRQRQEIASEADIEAAARQFVRKVSGFQRPAKKNEAPFEEAIREIAAISHRLLVAVTEPA
jgi:hypothetical protein